MGMIDIAALRALAGARYSGGDHSGGRRATDLSQARAGLRPKAASARTITHVTRCHAAVRLGTSDGVPRAECHA
jgi:hypothetical protein